MFTLVCWSVQIALAMAFVFDVTHPGLIRETGQNIIAFGIFVKYMYALIFAPIFAVALWAVILVKKHYIEDDSAPAHREEAKKVLELFGGTQTTASSLRNMLWHALDVIILVGMASQGYFCSVTTLFLLLVLNALMLNGMWGCIHELNKIVNKDHNEPV